MSNVYNRGKYDLAAQTWDWTGATVIHVALATTTYTYNADHNFASEITNELTGGGYARVATASRTLTENDTLDQAELDAADTTFSSLGAAAGSPTRAILLDNTTGADGTRPLITHNTLTTPPVPNGGDYTIQWDANGIYQLLDA